MGEKIATMWRAKEKEVLSAQSQVSEQEGERNAQRVEIRFC